MINVRDLPAGAKLVVETKNSIYRIEIVKQLDLCAEIEISGGERLTKPVKAYYQGSGFIANNKLELKKGMYLYVPFLSDYLFTSRVKKVSIC